MNDGPPFTELALERGDTFLAPEGMNVGIPIGGRAIGPPHEMIALAMGDTVRADRRLWLRVPFDPTGHYAKFVNMLPPPKPSRWLRFRWWLGL